MYFVDSVLPAPDSPDTIIDWDCFKTFMSLNALSAIANTCGGLVPRDLPSYDPIVSELYKLGISK